jgi:hypothetical protein
MKPEPRILRYRSMPLVCAALAAFLAMQGCSNSSGRDAEQAAQAAPPARTRVQGGQIILSLQEGARQRLDLATIQLRAVSVRLEIQAPAVVLSAQDLAGMRSRYLAMQAQAQKQKVRLELARREFARLRKLYENGQNASEKALEAAQGTMEENQTDEQTTEQQLALESSLIQQAWGVTVAHWVTTNSGPLGVVLAQKEMLVQVTIPSGDTTAPARISLEKAAGNPVAAEFVSPFPRVDPRIQGSTFLYIAPAGAALVPGVNLLTRLATGKRVRGLVIPSAAIVWSEGRAWAYRQRSANEFVRASVATDTPVEGGYLVTSGYSPGDRIVVQGAQDLLSEEMLLQGQGSAAEADTD